LMEHANGLWEENLRVPFMIWGANVPAGELGWIPTLADVAPTLMTMAGLRVPPDMNGAAVLLPADGSPLNGARAPTALRAAPAPTRALVAAQNHEVAVRDGMLKWVGRWNEEGVGAIVLRAFDLVRDPFETVPLDPVPGLLEEAAARELPRDTWPTRERFAISDVLDALLRGIGYAGR